MTKIQNLKLKKPHRRKSKPVWIIGAWNLDIVCNLLFGAWNFLDSKTQLFLAIRLDFFNVFVGQDTISPLKGCLGCHYFSYFLPSA